MTRHRAISLLSLVLLATVATTAASQALFTPKYVDLRLRSSDVDMSEQDAQLRAGTLQNYFRNGALMTSDELYLAMTTRDFYRIERHRLSRADLALQGAGSAATLGMFVSAIGTTVGAWDEDTSWYLVGAMTAVGALLGGTAGAKEPKFGVRIHWDDERP